LYLDGGTSQVVALAERLVDLGFLRVPRAGHYALTVAGKDLLGRSRTVPAPIPDRKRVPLLLPCLLAALAGAGLWVWLHG